MENINKALLTLEIGHLQGKVDQETIEKARQAKYFKREGTPGKYKYYYTKEEYNRAKGGQQTEVNHGKENKESEKPFKIGSMVSMFDDEPDLKVVGVDEWSDKQNTYDLESADGKIKRNNISQTKLKEIKSKEKEETPYEKMSNKEKEDFHRQKMEHYNTKGTTDGAKWHYHMAKRDEYKELNKRESENKEGKSKAASKVLNLMDSEEDGELNYGKYVNQVVKEMGVNKEELEKELSKYI